MTWTKERGAARAVIPTHDVEHEENNRRKTEDFIFVLLFIDQLDWERRASRAKGAHPMTTSPSRIQPGQVKEEVCNRFPKFNIDTR